MISIAAALLLVSLATVACLSSGPTPVPTESIPLPPYDFPDPPPNVPVGTARVNVNVRTGPGMLFSILGTAQKGDKGEILGISPDGYWYAIKVPTNVVGTGIAWSAVDYVDLSNPTGRQLPVVTPPLLPPLVNFPIPPASAPQVVMLEAATLRSGPTLEFPVYGVAPTGSQAEVLGQSEDGNWWVVRMPTDMAKDGTGWVPKLYTSPRNVTSPPVVKTPDLPKNINPAAPASGAPSLVTRDVLNVRTGPGNDYPSLGTVDIGTVLAVVGVSSNGEHYVLNVPKELNPSGQGWIQARFVRAENVDKVPIVQAPAVP